MWRLQGLGVIGRLGNALRQQDSAADALMDGAMIFFAGGLLLTPGVITDLFGFTLLIPWSRSFFKRWILRWFTNRFKDLPMAGAETFGSGSKDGKGGPGVFFGNVFFGQATFGGGNPFQGKQFANGDNDVEESGLNSDRATGDVIEGHIVERRKDDFEQDQNEGNRAE